MTLLRKMEAALIGSRANDRRGPIIAIFGQYR
jgi:hypothetical protein